MSRKDIREQLERAHELRAERWQPHEIVKQLQEEFDVGRAMANRYVRIAREKWDECDRETLRERKAEMRTWLWSHVEEAREAAKMGEPGARAAANKAADMLCKLDGLYEPLQVETSSPSVDVAQLTPETRAELRAVALRVKAETEQKSKAVH